MGRFLNEDSQNLADYISEKLRPLTRPKKWEYKRYLFRFGYDGKCHEALDEIGKQGWELVSAQEFNGENDESWVVWYFKRPKVEK